MGCQVGTAHKCVQKIFLIIIVSGLSFLGTQGHAGVYKWIDSQGVMHFGDQPPSDLKSEKVSGMTGDENIKNGLSTSNGNSGVDKVKEYGGVPVVIPIEVRYSWRAVKIEVIIKETNTRNEYEIPLNSRFEVPETDLVLEVGDFFPTFEKLDTITSRTNDLNNPAVDLKIYVKDVMLYKGFLFSKFPTVHPFVHNQYGVYLKSAIMN
jgi:hypothetical protein